MVARANFVTEKPKKDFPVNLYEAVPVPNGDYTIYKDDKNWTFSTDDEKWRYICVPGFFQLIGEDNVPVITVRGDYVLDRENGD